ncbi:alginate lyase family protein [Robiginitalea aurantiaca]|uniref:Alginate lyase family protein n=1 Tax=Robiginitalea aurantiaca TaxID=3056915 RepID=A0ABT7WD95_9FLAO|nr:alginate lyase family protein [Robiginitalea aurantiaca]MDM9630891.1 alginate lyase family protein [Robiginitalea aurantiaca]
MCRRIFRLIGVQLAVLWMAQLSMVQAQEHPKLILTKAGVERIRAELGTVPLFDASLERMQADVDAEIAMGIDTPIPRDYSGGYTHERHKRNFLMLQKAGVLYQILQDEKYARYVRDMLFQYEAMYKDLPIHPKERSYARGKLFWQCLNDSNWLVYVSQAYDCIYEWLSAGERQQLETNLFRPFADFISIENPQFFNRIHNHSTWGNAAVGMIGLVMGDEELVERALYGIKDDGLKAAERDDDGGLIRMEGQKAGFLANLDEPFSPDGYYTEGPYYQRYASYPFLLMAVGLQNIRPEMQIFAHKDSVLLKSVYALINLSDADGEFFPLNDAQKGMSYYSRELVSAVNIAYHYGEKDPELLSIAKKQGRVLLTDSGLSVALGLREDKSLPFEKSSVNLTDGAEGKEGGIAVLRRDDLELVFKYTAQGLSHGHYDKLSYMLYDRGQDILQDYGMARFVNIEQKGGGNYLKENTSWAKQSIAHNTLIQNETSHFDGRYETGSKHHSELYFYDTSNKEIQVVSAKERNAYPGTELHRTIALIAEEGYDHPIVLDILKVEAEGDNQYDLPFHFMGQLMEANFQYETPAALEAFGTKNGYQHLYLEGYGTPSGINTQLSWYRSGRFYTLITTSEAEDELLFTRLGADDPEFNLRRDAAFMVRRKGHPSTVFASIIEPHGSYSPVSEIAVKAESKIKALKILYSDREYLVVGVEDQTGNRSVFLMVLDDADKTKEHKLIINNTEYAWTGPYYYLKSKQ